jgi:hypothetical protein
MRNMETLIEKLEPEVKYKLDRIEELYPNTVDSIIRELEKCHHWADLSYNCIMDLVCYLELKDHEPMTIKDLFIEEKQ